MDEITRVSIKDQDEFKELLKILGVQFQEPNTTVINGEFEIYQEVKEQYTAKGAREFKPSGEWRLTLRLRYRVKE